MFYFCSNEKRKVRQLRDAAEPASSTGGGKIGILLQFH